MADGDWTYVGDPSDLFALLPLQGFGFIGSEIASLKRGRSGYYGDQRDDQYYVALGFDLFNGGYFR